MGRSCVDHDIERFEWSVMIESIYIKPLSGWQKSIALPHHSKIIKQLCC
jgi:hypothetical protein